MYKFINNRLLKKLLLMGYQIGFITIKNKGIIYFNRFISYC